MVAPADRGAGADEGMTGHLPGKLLCCCNCNSAATATVANVHRNYARSRHINCQFVEPPMWFPFAPSRLLDSTWLPAASCLGLSMPHLSVLATRCVHSFFATHTLFYRLQGMGTTDKSGPPIFLNEVFYLALSSLLVIGHADKRVRVRPLVFLGGMPPIEFRVVVPAGPRILS